LAFFIRDGKRPRRTASGAPTGSGVSPVEGCADGALAIAFAYRECSVAEALDAGYHEFLEPEFLRDWR
jgi:hypothetical protein